jgi:antirestriction protein ArdC
MRRDLHAEVSARIVAELEQGAAPWIKPWSATAGANMPCNAVTNRPYSGCNVVLLWMGANAGYRTPRYLTSKQASELGGNVRKGEHGTKVYFVKQLRVADQNGEEGETRIVPMMREYVVFNVDQCEGLPNRVLTPGEVKVRNIDERYPRRIIVASRCPQQFRLAAVLFLTQWSKVMYQTMEGKSLKIERNPSRSWR